MANKRYRVWSDERGIYLNYGGRLWRPLGGVKTYMRVGQYVQATLTSPIVGPVSLNNQELWCSDYGPSQEITRRLLSGTFRYEWERSVGLGTTPIPSCATVPLVQSTTGVEH